jgi:hypothetical protein
VEKAVDYGKFMTECTVKRKDFYDTFYGLSVAMRNVCDVAVMYAGAVAFAMVTDLNQQAGQAMIVPLIIYEGCLLADMVVRYKTEDGLAERSYRKLRDLSAALRKGR